MLITKLNWGKGKLVWNHLKAAKMLIAQRWRHPVLKKWLLKTWKVTDKTCRNYPAEKTKKETPHFPLALVPFCRIHEA